MFEVFACLIGAAVVTFFVLMLLYIFEVLDDDASFPALVAVTLGFNMLIFTIFYLLDTVGKLSGWR